jgi:hypothetical protein
VKNVQLGPNLPPLNWSPEDLPFCLQPIIDVMSVHEAPLFIEFIGALSDSFAQTSGG